MNLKSMKTTILLQVLTALICQSPGMADDRVDKVGTSAASFLRIPAGAHGAALGSAGVSRAMDATTFFWNPGAAARLERPITSFDRSSWLPGLTYSYLAACLPMGASGVLGLSYTSLASEQMDVTTPDFPMGTGETFDAASMALGLGYSRSLTDRFSIGVLVKSVQERIYHSTAQSLALDIGTLFDTPFKDIRLGISISNVGGKLQIDGEDLNLRVDIAPDQSGNNQSIVGAIRTDRFDNSMILRIGVSGDVLATEHSRLSWMLDGVNPNDNAPSLNLGLELSILNEALLLRTGYNDLFLQDAIGGFTAGFGVRVALVNGQSLHLDYAFQDFQYFGGVNRFTLGLSL